MTRNQVLHKNQRQLARVDARVTSGSFYSNYWDSTHVMWSKQSHRLKPYLHCVESRKVSSRCRDLWGTANHIKQRRPPEMVLQLHGDQPGISTSSRWAMGWVQCHSPGLMLVCSLLAGMSTCCGDRASHVHWCIQIPFTSQSYNMSTPQHKYYAFCCIASIHSSSHFFKDKDQPMSCARHSASSSGTPHLAYT